MHLSHKGHPIVGDPKYGLRDLDKQLEITEKSRLFLHAYKLSFIHPKTGLKISVEAPLYEDLVNVLEKIP